MLYMFNIAIIDDDINSIQNICSFIEKNEFYSHIELHRFLNTQQLIERSKKIHFNLLFVDIDLNDNEDGIELVNKYFYKVPVIYVTAYQDRMENAFGHNIYRYVLKNKLSSFFANDFSRIMEELLQVTIQIKDNNNLYLIEISDVYYVKYQNRNVYIYTYDDMHILKRRSLTSFIEPYKTFFIAVSRDVYVNWKYIKKVTKECYVVINNKANTSIPIPKNRYLDFIEEYIDKNGGIWF